MSEQCLAPQTFRYQQFDDPAGLLACKQARKLRISLCIPTLNEEATIAQVVARLRPLRDEMHLVDELAVMDSGSTDQTRRLAKAAGAEVYLASEILPEVGGLTGKGENLWKALYQLDGDILVFIDGDITNLHRGFVTGLIGPLLADDSIGYVKGFYARPSLGETVDSQGQEDDGGRLTEILVRPLLALFFPHLRGFVQPLAGEYAARRSLLEQLFFPSGYGVELAHLLDVAADHGLQLFAQTDLGRRCHRHRSNRQLGQAAYGLLQVVQRRLQRQGVMLRQQAELAPLVQFVCHQGDCHAEVLSRPEIERPPIIGLPQYRRHHVWAATDFVEGTNMAVVEE
nr:glucosyl-3-phosphoglycerate synthase [uncultured Desulfobulbus sp.]